MIFRDHSFTIGDIGTSMGCLGLCRNFCASFANKQLELMGRYMTELGLTPVARTRLDMPLGAQHAPVDKIEVVIVGVDEDGNRFDKPLLGGQPRERDKPSDNPVTITVNEDL